MFDDDSMYLRVLILASNKCLLYNCSRLSTWSIEVTILKSDGTEMLIDDFVDLFKA